MRPPRCPPVAVAVLVLVAVVLAAAGPAAAGGAPPGTLRAARSAGAVRAAAGPASVGAPAAVLVDAADGAVLWSRQAHEPRAPASLTKMVTALLVRSSLRLGDRAVAGRDAAAQPAKRLGLRPGDRLLVWQALQALLIVSANDVAVMLADRAGGSVGRFARAMDAESRRLGLRDSRWRNPNGLDAPGQRSSAFDLAILARAVLRDPWLAGVVRTREAAFVAPGGRRHQLSSRSRFLRGYPDAVGVKTGLTDDAGHCLAAAARRGGRTLIAVVLHSPDNAADAGRLLDWGFGPGRSTRTRARLPDPVAPASVAALLAPRPRPAAPTLAAAGPPGAVAAPRRPPAALAGLAAAAAGGLLLGGTGLAVRRRRRRPLPP